jgi:hypothetical protein
MGRAGLECVWERGFATEDEADEAYEQFERWLDAHPGLLCDRFDGNTIRVYVEKDTLEAKAQMIEVAFEPPTVSDRCTCGHIALSHRGEDVSCSVDGCTCRAFAREDVTDGAT